VLAGSSNIARGLAVADDGRSSNAGSSFQFVFDHSKIFPGTSRTITVYVPAQYTAEKPACLYVALDRLGFGAPAVFDDLISKREMPVTIGIGLSPGTVNSVSSGKDPRFNRSVEFDGLNDQLAQFLIEELMPELERRKTPAGLPILLSKDPNDHAAGGASTGGVGAFTLAWERPDAFRRVFTAIGTFVGMRGADRYPVLVRKTEPKPLRIFMQDGASDEWMGGPEFGDWWMSNQTLERALKFAGYSVEHVWGEGSHDDIQATEVFANAMRWLWKDWPRPVTAGQSGNTFLNDILIPGEGWRDVPSTEVAPRKLLADAQNYRARDALGREYSSDTAAGKVWLRSGHGKRVLIDSQLRSPTGIALSPDGLWLAVAESKTHWGYSYRVEPDGTVTAKERFYWFHTPDDADDSGVGAWVMDRAGRLYAATRLGVQVFDHNGRVRAILPVPTTELVSIAFAGAGMDVLYIGSRDHKIYRRKMHVSGTATDATPNDVPVWGPG